jgi:predicted phage tail protein
MLKKIKLYGELAERYGKEWYFDINSPRDAFKALAVNNEGFKEFVSSSEERGVGYKVIIGNNYINDYAELGFILGRQEIKIVPVVLGAKKGLGMILVGVLMIIGIGWAMGNVVLGELATFGMGQGYGFMQTVGVGLTNLGTLGMMGVQLGSALIMGGVAQMLAQPPVIEDPDKATNYTLGGPVNTTKQGVSVPICYGQILVGGATISAGVFAEDYIPE